MGGPATGSATADPNVTWLLLDLALLYSAKVDEFCRLGKLWTVT